MKHLSPFLCLLCISILPAWVCGQQVKNLSGTATGLSIKALERDIPKFMETTRVPGLSAALIQGGKLAWVGYFGVQNADNKIPVSDSTIFEAASLTKIVTAYAALKLVEEGLLNLDTPLNKYLGNNYDVGIDPRIQLITARRVLTHTSGFPNWRSQDSKTLPINFSPGEKFSYSGEGFVYLSKVVEKISGMDFEAYVQKAVFNPLKMTNSHLRWKDEYRHRFTWRHDWTGKPSYQADYKNINAAASLRTTASDYARFVIAILNGEGLQKKTWQEMLKAQVKVNDTSQVFWGLGLGLQTNDQGQSFWHWGDQGDSKCFVVALVGTKDAFVYFANGANGLSFTPELLDDALGGKYPAVAWLNYPKHDPAAPLLLQAVLDQGAAPALKTYQEKVKNGGTRINESYINNIGYILLRSQKVDDAIEVMTQNTNDYPESSNAWDSLAEAYMIKGNKELAIKYYEKSLALNPGNGNAIEQLKKLKS